MKKSLPILLIVMIAVMIAPKSTQAAGAGNLIKCPDFSAVYYLAEDGERYVFPSDKIFFTYFYDFNEVKNISCADLAGFRLGGNIPYHAGTRLVKMPSVATTYAVEPNGRLRAIPDEQTAINLYGEDWADDVDDLSEAFFPGYQVSDPLAADELPIGMMIEDNNNMYVVQANNRAILRYGDGQSTGNSSQYRHRTQAQHMEQHYEIVFDDDPDATELAAIDDYDSPIAVDESEVVEVDEIAELTDFEIWYADDHVMGDLATAQVVMIEYGDLQCIYCAHQHANLLEIMDTYGDDVAWIWRHFPIDALHAAATPAAQASECAAEQGAFWDFITGVLEEQSNIDDFMLFDLAQDLGLDVERFIECYATEEYADAVQADYDLGLEAGVYGTPTTFIGNETITGAVDYDVIANAINQIIN